ncbi:unnamed protein product, partial [Mycena citricolor]
PHINSSLSAFRTRVTESLKHGQNTEEVWWERKAAQDLPRSRCNSWPSGIYCGDEGTEIEFQSRKIITGLSQPLDRAYFSSWYQAVPSRRDPATPKPKSESKIKLKEAKAILAAKSSSLKKDRKKRRKELTGRPPAVSQDSSNITAQPTKKRVSFA